MYCELKRELLLFFKGSLRPENDFKGFPRVKKIKNRKAHIDTSRSNMS